MSKKIKIVIAVIVVAVLIVVGLFAYKYLDIKKGVEEVETLISAIGYNEDGTPDCGVTPDSKESIAKARKKYDSAEDSVKKKVSNYEILTSSEERLKAIEGDIAEVENKINEIGYNEDVENCGITLESEEKITSARTSYDDFREPLKKYVSNYDILEKSEKILANLKKAKEEEEARAKAEAEARAKAEAEAKAKARKNASSNSGSTSNYSGSSNNSSNELIDSSGSFDVNAFMDRVGRQDTPVDPDPSRPWTTVTID